MSLTIGFLIYPNLTQLDFTGPYEVLARVPGASMHVAAKTLDPVTSDSGLQILPTVTLADCPQLDVLVVPGGPSVDDWYEDAEIIGFLRAQGATAKYVTSVCTGSLILGAAGLLDGYKATTHWAAMDNLAPFGAIPTEGRVVRDRNRITGGGVTAGVDFAFSVVAELAGPEVAKAIQLGLEYNPEPLFKGGHPSVAEPELVEAVTAMMADRLDRRRQAAQRHAVAG
ncbi:DJ-1/PfpI family protein [Kordiimonas lacus]|uniref:Cyclohexyl-isocyanide hydratase n=1 Tax=Kordiimonas lacus TaxID=637679 RepID=A0A1G6THF0_9PROT|nr:DJ-1/PfpI family protein [Kordiimonas lacus]SDD28471.1 cyclohexyl-isocyanide hydratase [Kordiimonas lacus]